MKIKSIIVSMILAGILISTTRFFAMSKSGRNVIETGLLEEQAKSKQRIATGVKVMSIGALATLLAIPIAYLTYLANKYVKDYGMPTVAVAVRYLLPFQPTNLQLLKNAADHDDEHLKADLIALNSSLFGENWREARTQILADFIAMDRAKFTQKYDADRYKRIVHMFKMYAAAADLFMRKSKIRTYTRGIPSLAHQAKYMRELDQIVGVE